jgi:hypothetical protein
VTPLFLLVALAQVPDSGVLVIRQDGLVLARESFHVAPSPATGGWRLEASVRYERDRPAVVLTAILDLGRDTLPQTLQYDVGNPGAPIRILGQAGRHRFTVRYLARAAERAHEFPADAHTIILDDSLFSPYLVAGWRGASVAQSLSAIFPRDGRREALTVQAQDGSAPLRRVVVTGGAAATLSLWLDSAGRLMKLEIPSRRLVIERQSDR